MTLRELLWMAEGHERQAWEHTSAMMALIANSNRDPKTNSKAFRAEDFNPYTVESHPQSDAPLMVPLKFLKPLWVKSEN